MLIQKNISTKKLVICIIIIIVMITGTGLMFYENYKLTTRKKTNVNAPIVFNNLVPIAPSQATAGQSQALSLDKINQSGGLNLNIFLSDKFKNLQENKFIINEQPELGKRNPFNPN